jgi:dihydroorotate dehydrogenase
LQDEAALNTLLQSLQTRRDQLAQRYNKAVPVFVKVAPDLGAEQLSKLAATLMRHGIDGVIATNTTVARDAVQGLRHGAETGGLSGGPVLEASNRVIRQLRAELGTGYPIIGVGGVMDADSARSKIAAGADLVQIYTGLIYKGATLVGDVARALKL